MPEKKVKRIYLDEFKPHSYFKPADQTPEKAKYPVIDLHNHLFGEMPAHEMIRIMDATGVRIFNNLSGNARILSDDDGYTIERCHFQDYAESHIQNYPDRFIGFTMSDFAQWNDFTLIRDNDFADKAIQHLEEDLEKGALGLKITKELGLRFRDYRGHMIPVNDERLFPIWRRAGELKIPVLIHVSDPIAFFDPIDQTNEHYQTLARVPGWSFHDAHFSKKELMAQRDSLVASFPETTFICPHVANYAEDLEVVSDFLDSHPNAFIDFSARMDELGRKPYTARDFMIKYQDRILFGADMPLSEDMYRCYFRFLETADEYFEYPDYVGTWTYTRWKIYGLKLPDEVLRKIYYQNAQKIIPRLMTLM